MKGCDSRCCCSSSKPSCCHSSKTNRSWCSGCNYRQRAKQHQKSCSSNSRQRAKQKHQTTGIKIPIYIINLTITNVYSVGGENPPTTPLWEFLETTADAAARARSRVAAIQVNQTAAGVLAVITANEQNNTRRAVEAIVRGVCTV